VHTPIRGSARFARQPAVFDDSDATYGHRQVWAELSRGDDTHKELHVGGDRHGGRPDIGHQSSANPAGAVQ
jgi:hypothetical protein